MIIRSLRLQALADSPDDFDSTLARELGWTTDALVASVLSWAGSEGAALVWLHVSKRNERARRFYQRIGFRPTGNEVLRERDGMVEVEMNYALGRGPESR